MSVVQGKWTPRKIPNPSYFEDLEPYKMTPIVSHLFVEVCATAKSNYVCCCSFTVPLHNDLYGRPHLDLCHQSSRITNYVLRCTTRLPTVHHSTCLHWDSLVSRVDLVLDLLTQRGYVMHGTVFHQAASITLLLCECWKLPNQLLLLQVVDDVEWLLCQMEMMSFTCHLFDLSCIDWIHLLLLEMCIGHQVRVCGSYAVIFTWDLLPPSTAWLLFSARSCFFPLSLWISLQCRSLNLLGVFPINIHLLLSKVAADSLFAAFHKSLFLTWSRILLNSMTHSKFSFEGHFRK